MVITVIAILALLLIPLFRDRVEAARRAAAQDEIQTFVKAEQLAYADTGRYYRLQDLDNTQTFVEPPQRADEEVPIASWNHPFTPEERRRLVAPSLTAWKGPYISMNKFKYLELRDAVTALPEFFWSNPGRGGPIMDLQPSVSYRNPTMSDQPEDKIPIDPWGTPYLFFGTGKLMEEGGIYASQETNFGNAAAYSLGPDGLPSLGVLYQGNAQLLLRESGAIGMGDDYLCTF